MNAAMALAAIGSISLVAGLTTGTIAATAAGSVRFAAWTSGPAEDLGQKRLIESFQSKYGVTVDFVPLTGHPLDSLEALFAAGTAPDVFYDNSDWFQELAASGSLLNLDFLKKDKSFGYSQYYKNLQLGYLYHGHVYGIVKDYSTLALWYNRDLFRAAHISRPPTTWAQLRSDACKLTHKSSNVYGVSLSADPARWAAFFIANGGGSTGGGGFLNKAQTRAYIAGKAGVDSLSFYAGLVRNGCAVQPQDVGAKWNGEAFGRQSVAMAIEGNWMTSYMQQTFPSVHWGLAPLPKGPTGKQGNLAFTAAYSAYARTGNQTNTLKFLKYVAGKAGTTVWTHVVGYLPARKDVKPPAITRVFAEQTKYARDWFFPPGFESAVLYPMGDDIQSVMVGLQSAQAAINDMQARADQALTGRS
jgi:multiple sugar transport system substrate-binding protein